MRTTPRALRSPAALALAVTLTALLAGSSVGAGSVAGAAVTPTLTSVASPSTFIGLQIFDNANLAGAVNPTGFMTFNLFGPADLACTTPIFTSTVTVAGTSVNSMPFTATAAGTYRWTAAYSGDANNTPAGPTTCGDIAEQVVVAKATTVLTTIAAVPVGSSIHDTATLGGGFNPTGTITFTLFAPGDTFCSGPSVSTSTVPVNGNGIYNSATFAAPVSGTYKWRASYSGDANNLAAGPTPCLDPNEQVNVTAAPTPTLTTTASASVPPGGAISDTANLAGTTAPTGTITFNLFGPDNATCSGTPSFSSTKPVTGNGSYTSSSFTPTAPGTYRWQATYSGDANNPAVGPSACADPAEAVVVTAPPPPTLTTLAAGSVPLGGSTHDTATLFGGTNPTGTITFNLYGPNDATCTAPAIFTAAVSVNGTGTYSSPSFTPTAPGTYRWRASYSGDANNPAVGPSACADPLEAVAVMAPATPTLTTTASPGSVVLGGAVHDTATLAGGNNPTGTITFGLYDGPNPGLCLGGPVFTATVPVTGNGVYNSPDFTPTGATTYRWRASYSGDANNNAVGLTACVDPAEAVVVTAPPAPTLVTTASALVVLGGAIHDTATLAGGGNPTGTIAFTLFGPNDATCTGTATFTATVPVSGAGTYNSPNFTPSAPGTYRWRAGYSGDANNVSVGPTLCVDPLEAVTVTQSIPTIVTNASSSVVTGGVIHDTATLAGAANPTGTITFNLYGPNDATCAAAPVFTSSVPVTANGNYDSANFTATIPGTYRWRASYSGDADNAAAGPTPCTDPAEAVVVAPGGSNLSTTASPSVTTGGAIHDTAALSGAVSPTGTITFTLFGPDDATCSTATVFTSTTTVAGSGVYDSASFTPTAPGTYRWRASYSGDANNNPAGPTACDDPNETVSVVAPTITVDETTQSRSQPEPGGTFTLTITVTNTSDQPLTLTSLFDEDLNGQGTCRLPQALAPNGGQYSCTFPIVFTGNAGNQRVVTVTATAVGPVGTVTASDTLVLSLTNVAPVISATKTADPPSRPEPGGSFTFGVTVTNSGAEPVVLSALTDDRYGDLDGLGSCQTGGLIAAGGATYSCSFTGTFTGRAGDAQTDTVTATALDDDASTTSTKAVATVTLTAPTPTPTPTPGPGATGGHGATVGVPVGGTPSGVVSVVPLAGGRLAHTGADARRGTRLAIALILVGLLLVAAAWRRKPPAVPRRS